MSTENKSLVALTEDYQRLMGLLMETGGELTPEIEKELEVNTEMLAAKADKYEFITSKLEAEEAYFKAKADSYTRVARACANARQRLRDAIKFSMQQTGKTEIIGEDTTFCIVNGAPKLVIKDPGVVPKNYVVETIVRDLDKDKIKADLKAGKSVPGAEFEPVYQLRTKISRKVK
jgi:hypothetical protein